MRSLIIGILLFLVWSAFATWYYVCRVNDFCGEIFSTVMEPVEVPEPAADSLANIPEEKITPPENIVIHFAYNSAQFTTNAMISGFLDACKTYMEKVPESYIMITGHTCSIGTSAYNMDLGQRRAESVASYFKDYGLPGERIRTQSRGENEPVSDNSTEAGRELNRRSEITIKQ